MDGASATSQSVEHSVFDQADLREYAGLYLSGTSPTHPDCSPVLADLQRFASLGKVYLESAADELLHADAELLARRLAEAGLDMTRHIEANAHHGWQLFPDLLPEAKASLQRLADFITQA